MDALSRRLTSLKPAALRSALPRKRRFVLAALILVAVCLGGARPTAADDISDKQKQQAQVAQLITGLQNQIATSKNQQATLRQLITAVDGQIAQTQAQADAAREQLLQIQTKLAEAQANLITVQADVAKNKKQLAEEVVLTYQLGAQQTTLNSLLTANSAQDFWQQLDGAQHFTAGQNQLTDRLHQEELQVQVDIDSINAEQTQQKQVVAQIASAMAALQQQRNQREAAAQVLAQVQAQDEQRLAEAEAAQKQIEQQIAELQAEAAAAAAAAAAHGGGGNGHFIWPESGPLSQGFGCTPYYFEPYDPNCASRHFHSGIDIAAACGTAIAAADGGIVNTYWTNYGYGHYIIIIHGNGWASLYGHMSSFTVSNGQAVGRGQQIGYEGSTGNSTGCHLHFEVRYNNVPRDPIALLP